MAKETKLMRAIKLVSQERRDNPEAKLIILIDRAALQFDLTPAQSEALTRQLTQATAQGQ